MGSYTKILKNARCIERLFESTGRDICKRQGLSQLELDIIAFLHINPESDTASDIAEHCMLPKANISQAVEALRQKQFLSRSTDRHDRRRIHLSLTERAEELVPEIMAARAEFLGILFRGFSSEEKAAFEKMSARISKNSLESMEKAKKT